MIQPRSPRILGGLILLLILGAGIGLFWHRQWHTTPTYQDRTVDYWISQCIRATTPGELETADKALRALRKESLPILATLWLEASEPDRLEAARALLEKLAKRYGLARRVVRDEDIRSGAEFVFQTFHPSAEELLPVATRLFQKGSRHRAGALKILQWVAHGRERCADLLVRAYAEGDLELGEFASEIADGLYREDGVPPEPLLRALTDHVVRSKAGFGDLDHSYSMLGAFGPSASGAVSVVRQRFQDEPEDSSKIQLARTLAQIDPAADDAWHYLAGLSIHGTNGPRTLARMALAHLGSGPGAVQASNPKRREIAMRLWNAFQQDQQGSEDALATLEVLVRLREPRAELLAHLDRERDRLSKQRDILRHRLANTPAIAAAADESELSSLESRLLNTSWYTLQLQPDHAAAWEVLEGFLVPDLHQDPHNSKVLLASIAMEYLVGLPIPREAKKERLRRVISEFDQPGTRHEHLGESAWKHLIQLDPAEQPSDFHQRIRIYLD